jgi:hypothetical protein
MKSNGTARCSSSTIASKSSSGSLRRDRSDKHRERTSRRAQRKDHPTLSEFSYIGQSRGEGKPLPRWRKRRLRRERDILRASDLLAFFSCCVALVLSTRLHAQSNPKAARADIHRGLYFSAFLRCPAKPAGKASERRNHDRGTRLSVQSVAAAIEDAYAPPIGEVLPRDGRES